MATAQYLQGQGRQVEQVSSPCLGRSGWQGPGLGVEVKVRLVYSGHLTEPGRYRDQQVNEITLDIIQILRRSPAGRQVFHWRADGSGCD